MPGVGPRRKRRSHAAGWTALLSLLLVPASPSTARADWQLAPFVGGTFAGATALLDLEHGASSAHLVLGGHAGWWSEGILGLETDFAFAPRFFESDSSAGLVASSHVVTLGANVIVTTPVSVTRESLRPYLVGGVGWLHASIEETTPSVFPDILGRANNSIAMNVGGGATGFVTARTGFRFELRQFRSLERDENLVTGERKSLLSFWRATVGVVIRP